MSEEFRIQFGDLLSGWLPIELLMGNQQLFFYASYTPYDSLRELLDALISFLAAEGQSTARWNTEPIEYDFVFIAGESVSSPEVVEYPDHRRRLDLGKTVYIANKSQMQIALPFWRQLRRVKYRPGFVDQWKRAFPSRELGVLHDFIKKKARNDC
jgi:hypothetical protein